MSNSQSAVPAKPAIATPTIKRRLISLVYDFVLAVAVGALGALLYAIPFRGMSENFHEVARPIMLILVTGMYFVHAWTGSGHTLAMKTWRIKIVKVGMARVPVSAALVRYVMAWGWFLPGLTMYWILHLSLKQTAGAVVLNVLLWGMTALLDKDRQLLHDRVAGTRLISLPKPARN